MPTVVRALFTTAGRKLKVLALHGKGGSGASMARKLAPLVTATESEWEWHFATAPHAVDPPRSGSAWWRLPPGVRSFEAEEFDGVDASLAALSACWTAHGPFDAVLGHSQGAMLTGIATAQAMVEAAARGEEEESAFFRPKCAVLTGAAWPNPFGDLFLGLKEAQRPTAVPVIPTLHCWGTVDTMNPPSMAKRLCGCFPGSVGLEHAGGHVVPQDPVHLDAIRAFVNNNAAAAAAAGAEQGTGGGAASSGGGSGEDEATSPSYGVSYLSGDPCSSTYNDDPFGEQDAKPDAWKQMNNRIKALVEEKKRKEADEAAPRDF